MKTLIKSILAALSLALLGSASLAADKKLYPPESWKMTVKFLNFPYRIECREEHGHGRIRTSGSDRNLTYEIDGFPQADRLICMVPNGRSFAVNMKYLFGTGNTERRMGREYFEGEIRRIDLKVRHQGNGTGHESHKAHVTLRTVRGKERVIYFDEEMMVAFFPERANLPTRRWKD